MAGIEPAVRLTPHSCLANRRLRPLSHISSKYVPRGGFEPPTLEVEAPRSDPVELPGHGGPTRTRIGISGVRTAVLLFQLSYRAMQRSALPRVCARGCGHGDPMGGSTPRSGQRDVLTSSRP